MKKAHFEFEEIPFSTLARFGLTQEMIEDLPMHVLDDIYNGRHSPVLPVRVTDEHGETVESRTRFALIRMEGGQTDVVFYPALKSSPLERFDETQQKQLLEGKAIIADVETADGRHNKAFVQIDTGTKQVMYVPTCDGAGGQRRAPGGYRQEPCRGGPHPCGRAPAAPEEHA